MDYAKLAINNISKYGDTDIFPFPMENALFFDNAKEVKNLIVEMEKNFDTWMANDPVDSIKTCVPVGYTGYRWATFIEPLWNCFLLYQTLKISEILEKNRISVDKQCVFSYRLKIDEKTNKIFDSSQNWRAFCSRAIQIAETDEANKPLEDIRVMKMELIEN